MDDEEYKAAKERKAKAERLKTIVRCRMDRYELINILEYLNINFFKNFSKIRIYL